MPEMTSSSRLRRTGLLRMGRPGRGFPGRHGRARRHEVRSRPVTAGRPARVEHAGMIDAATLRFLADCAQIRIALLSPDGAVLHLGRTQRLASATPEARPDRTGRRLRHPRLRRHRRCVPGPSRRAVDRGWADGPRQPRPPLLSAPCRGHGDGQRGRGPQRLADRDGGGGPLGSSTLLGRLQASPAPQRRPPPTASAGRRTVSPARHPPGTAPATTPATTPATAPATTCNPPEPALLAVGEQIPIRLAAAGPSS